MPLPGDYRALRLLFPAVCVSLLAAPATTVARSVTTSATNVTTWCELCLDPVSVPVELIATSSPNGSGDNVFVSSNSTSNWTVAASGVLSTSADGGAAYSWEANRWVVGGSSPVTPGNFAAVSDDGGLTWAGVNVASLSKPAGTIFNVLKMTFAPMARTWVAAGSGDLQLACSQDGRIWTSGSVPAPSAATAVRRRNHEKVFSASAKGVAYSASTGMWLAVGSNPGTSMVVTSTDGCLWTRLTVTSSPMFTDANAVAYSDFHDRWVAVGDAASTGHALACTSGGSVTATSWTGLGTSIFNERGLDVAVGAPAGNADVWVAVGKSTPNSTGYSIAYSSDGTTFVGVASSMSIFESGAHGVTFSSRLNQWIAVGAGSYTVATSPDGIVWTGSSALHLPGASTITARPACVCPPPPPPTAGPASTTTTSEINADVSGDPQFMSEEEYLVPLLVAVGVICVLLCLVGTFLIVLRKKAAAQVHAIGTQSGDGETAPLVPGARYGDSSVDVQDSAPTGEVVMVFTDIQSSTALWEEMEDTMRLTLRLHDELIRELLKEFNGYEVKTEGDAFFAAFSSADEAVRFALRLQLDLMAVSWPKLLAQHPDAVTLEQPNVTNDDEPGSSYAGTKNGNNGPPRRAERNGLLGVSNEEMLHSRHRAHSSTIAKKYLYRGVRVRCGMHLGSEGGADPNLECKRDQRSGRMDYFGRSVNRAARVQGLAVGGMTVMTEAVLEALLKEGSQAVVLAADDDEPPVPGTPTGEKRSSKKSSEGKSRSKSPRKSPRAESERPARESPRSDFASSKCGVYKFYGDFHLKGLREDTSVYTITPSELTARPVPDPAYVIGFRDPKTGKHFDAAAAAARARKLRPESEELDPRYVIDIDQLEIGETLAEGNFGVVSRGEYAANMCVIKQLRVVDQKALADLRKEALILSHLPPHASLMTFYGAVLTPPKLCLVTEYIAGGSLASMMADPAEVFTGVDLVSMARDLCSGMMMLHEAAMLHLDLAARNVLVLNTHARPLKLRIADFGLSRLIPDGESSVTAVGYQVPYRYLDPAVLHEHAFDKETDVWAGGVLFWEMAARRTPYEEIPVALDVLYACSKGLRLQRPTPRFPVRMPDAVLDEFYDVMKSCWVTENRPTFRKLASKFGEMIKRGEGDLTGEDASKNKVEHKGAPVATSFTPYQQMVTNHHRVEDGYGDLDIRSSADPSTPQVRVPSGTASPVPGHQLVLPPGTTMLYDAQGKPYFQNNVDKTTSYEIPKGAYYQAQFATSGGSLNTSQTNLPVNMASAAPVQATSRRKGRRGINSGST